MCVRTAHAIYMHMLLAGLLLASPLSTRPVRRRPHHKLFATAGPDGIAAPAREHIIYPSPMPPPEPGERPVVDSCSSRQVPESQIFYPPLLDPALRRDPQRIAVQPYTQHQLRGIQRPAFFAYACSHCRPAPPLGIIVTCSSSHTPHPSRVPARFPEIPRRAAGRFVWARHPDRKRVARRTCQRHRASSASDTPPLHFRSG